MTWSNIPYPKALQRYLTPRKLAFFGIAYLGVLFIVPILYLMMESLNFGDGSLLVHYEAATRSVYLMSIRNSLRYGVEVTIMTILLAYLMGYFLAFRTKRQIVYLVFILLPLWVAIILRYLGVQLFLFPNGPLVEIFGTDFGLLYSRPAVYFGLVAALLPFSVLPIFYSLNNIDESLIDASNILGAGKYRTIYSVVIPLSLPGTIVAGILVFILSAGSYLAPAILGGPNNVMIANMITQAYLEQFNIEMAAALSSVFTFVLLAILLIFNRIVNIDEVLSSI